MKPQLTHRSRRAIFLISILFFSILIVMFVEAALVLAPGSFARAAADSSLSEADQAARSGIDWVRARISSDPAWNATTAQNFAAPGLFVTEGNGQVEGWVKQNNGWSRFRLRFNYQDGPQVATSDSDNMNDPPTAWQDFPYVSCNNLQGGSARIAPLARLASASTNPAPWPASQAQLTVPANTLLVSVEGSSGPVTLSGSGQPTGFSAGAHKKTVQSMLKFSSNQPITNAAIMSAGDLVVNVYGTTPLQLNSVGAGQTSRLRTKGQLQVGNVTSTKGDLRYVSGMINGTLSSGITNGADNAGDGFYQIPLSKVRTPSGSLTLAAGTYVVTDSGTVMYYNMDYQAYATATPAPIGTPTTLPTGMALAGPNASPTPKYRINITSDVKVTPSGAANDLALIPDGGAPQSAAYGGVPSATPSATASPATGFVSSLSIPSNGFVPGFLSGTTVGHWAAALSGLPTSPGAIGYTNYQLPNGSILGLPSGGGNLFFGAPPFLFGAPLGSGNPADLATALGAVSPVLLGQLQSDYGYIAPSASPSASATPTTLLSSSDLELNLQGGAGGLTFANSNGSITLGAQIQGNGASITSSKDIALIGTSTDLSSSPGAALGLNLYAQGTVTIDAFKIDSSGAASFHGVNLKGIVYAWQGINVLVGNSTTSAPFNMVGSMVAYGGNPTGSPSPGMAKTTINAQSASIQFDPSYVSGLVSSGPFTMQVITWHEF